MHINVDNGGLAVITATIESDGYGFDPGDLVIIDHFDVELERWIVKSAFDSSLTCIVTCNEIVAINVKDIVRYLKQKKENS